jgi:hypothetical protein
MSNLNMAINTGVAKAEMTIIHIPKPRRNPILVKIRSAVAPYAYVEMSDGDQTIPN